MNRPPPCSGSSKYCIQPGAKFSEACCRIPQRTSFAAPSTEQPVASAAVHQYRSPSAPDATAPTPSAAVSELSPLAAAASAAVGVGSPVLGSAERQASSTNAQPAPAPQASTPAAV